MEIFDDTTIAAAIVRRLMRNAVVFNIDGPSLAEHRARTAATTDPSRPR